MTTPTTSLPAVGATEDLTDKERRTELLAANAGDLPWDDVIAELIYFAHRTLSRRRRVDLLEGIREWAEGAASIRKDAGEIARWFDEGDFYGCPGPVDEVAAAELEKRAAKALDALTYGEGER